MESRRNAAGHERNDGHHVADRPRIRDGQQDCAVPGESAKYLPHPIRQIRRNSMKLRLLPVLVASLFLAPGTVLAHDADESGKNKLGTVKFSTSCDPKVQ